MPLRRCLHADPPTAITLDSLPLPPRCNDHSRFYLARLCAFRPAAFQIHFQVNTAWPTTNLEPTGVVTAVADNGKSKLQPRSGMFTVTTGKLAVNIFFFLTPNILQKGRPSHY